MKTAFFFFGKLPNKERQTLLRIYKICTEGGNLLQAVNASREAGCAIGHEYMVLSHKSHGPEAV